MTYKNLKENFVYRDFLIHFIYSFNCVCFFSLVLFIVFDCCILFWIFKYLAVPMLSVIYKIKVYWFLRGWTCVIKLLSTYNSENVSKQQSLQFIIQQNQLLRQTCQQLVKLLMQLYGTNSWFNSGGCCYSNHAIKISGLQRSKVQTGLWGLLLWHHVTVSDKSRAGAAEICCVQVIKQQTETELSFRLDRWVFLPSLQPNKMKLCCNETSRLNPSLQASEDKFQKRDTPRFRSQPCSTQFPFNVGF